MTAAEVLEALALRHPERDGEWLFVREWERIDGYAISCWKGQPPFFYKRVAYEVKVSMTDYRAELARPFKRAKAVEVSNEFYFAVPREMASKVRPTLPLECGLIAAHPGGSRVIVPAPKRPARGWTDTELVTLLRWRMNPSATRSLEGQLERARLSVRTLEQFLERSERRADMAEARLAELRGGDVTPGTEWRGVPHDAAEDGLWRVERLLDHRDGALAVLSRVDAGEGVWAPRAYISVGALLARAERVGVAAPGGSV